MKINTIIAAGQTLEYFEPGDFFRLMDASQPVNVRLYKDGREVSSADAVGEGYAERFRNGSFDRVQIHSDAAQEISFVIRLDADVFYDKPPTGAVTLDGMQGVFTQSQKTVTNASTQLLAPKLNRRYLLIQNNDAAGIVYVTLDGTTATAANGVKLEPGASLELQSFVPSGSIRAIGSIASNANVIVVEG